MFYRKHQWWNPCYNGSTGGNPAGLPPVAGVGRVTPEGTAVAPDTPPVDAGEVVRGVVREEHAVVEAGGDGDLGFGVVHNNILSGVLGEVKCFKVYTFGTVSTPGGKGSLTSGLANDEISTFMTRIKS